MDYRMYSGGAPAGENVVTLIKESLKEQGIKINSPLRFVGFEGSAGMMFHLNDHEEPIAIPSTGKFITPFNGERFMPIYSLVFDGGFSGNIYYIV